MPHPDSPNDADRTRLLAQFAVERADLMVFHADPDGHILYANETACRALRYSLEQLTTLRVFDIDTDRHLAPENSTEWWDRVREQRTVVRLTEFRAGSGRLIPVEVSSNYIEFEGRPYVVAVARDITERRRSERLLRLMQASIEQSGSAVFWITSDAKFFYVNRHACESLGYTQAELLAASVQDIAPDIGPDRWLELWSGLGRQGTGSCETRHRRKDGRSFPVELSLNRVEYQGDEYLFTRARDLSERHRAAAALRDSEERLRQSQKMEAIGRLAGGVAHDFNNLLTAILGYSELLIPDFGEDDPRLEYVTEIRNAADRAAHMTRQLLTFSRKQVVQPKPLDPNAVIVGFERMLRRLITETVRLRIVAGEGLGHIMADQVQVEQVLMNLALNARDAMPDGGELTIETARVAAVGAGGEFPQRTLAPGEYVRLTVTDTGTGMSDEVASHVFEPFFSTKEGEKGTGLGLATVYGIVQQAGGHISVRSEPGRGTAFDIYLPRTSAGSTREAEVPDEPAATATVPGTVLGVEDDVLVLQFVRDVLGKSGYGVIEASGPEEALSLVAAHRGRLDLLVTDVVMPVMNGRELADRVVAQHPETAVLFISGYADQVREEDLAPGRGFEQKPFTPDGLLAKVRQVLGGIRP
jgi:two-component system, cell cycle sensor histidine kinase and response regulator CckA